MSGLNQYIANVPYAKVYRGFESLPLRHIHIRPNSYKSTIIVNKLLYQTVSCLQASIHIHCNPLHNTVYYHVIKYIYGININCTVKNTKNSDAKTH